MARHKYSDNDFIDAVKTSKAISEVLRKLGLATAGGSYKSFYQRVKKLGIDTSHFLGQGHNKGVGNKHYKVLSFEEFLIKDSNRVFRSSFKKRVIEAGLLKNECSKCGIKDTWQNEPIVLHVDHINGDHFDHRLENLRMLCPNCHSQTETYCSKNNKNYIHEGDYVPQAPHTCEGCDKKIDTKYKNCRECSNLNRKKNKKEQTNKCNTCGKTLDDNYTKNCKACYDKNRKTLQDNSKRKTKIVWPPIEEISLKLKTSSYVALGKELGVSDNAIRKYIKRNEKH